MPGGRGVKRGGYQAPARPAAVSGPGALSQRTDSPATQPVRVAPGGDYGSRQALVGQQQAAPMAAGGPGPAPVGGVASGAAPLPDPFGPSNRPQEPVTAGAALGPGGPPTDSRVAGLAALQALFAAEPSADLQAMIEQAQREAGRG